MRRTLLAVLALFMSVALVSAQAEGKKEEREKKETKEKKEKKRLHTMKPGERAEGKLLRIEPKRKMLLMRTKRDEMLRVPVLRSLRVKKDGKLVTESLIKPRLLHRGMMVQVSLGRDGAVVASILEIEEGATPSPTPTPTTTNK